MVSRLTVIFKCAGPSLSKVLTTKESNHTEKRDHFCLQIWEKWPWRKQDSQAPGVLYHLSSDGRIPSTAWDSWNWLWDIKEVLVEPYQNCTFSRPCLLLLSQNFSTHGVNEMPLASLALVLTQLSKCCMPLLDKLITPSTLLFF